MTEYNYVFYGGCSNTWSDGSSCNARTNKYIDQSGKEFLYIALYLPDGDEMVEYNYVYNTITGRYGELKVDTGKVFWYPQSMRFCLFKYYFEQHTQPSKCIGDVVWNCGNKCRGAVNCNDFYQGGKIVTSNGILGKLNKTYYCGNYKIQFRTRKQTGKLNRIGAVEDMEKK